MIATSGLITMRNAVGGGGDARSPAGMEGLQAHQVENDNLCRPDLDFEDLSHVDVKDRLIEDRRHPRCVPTVR